MIVLDVHAHRGAFAEQEPGLLRKDGLREGHRTNGRQEPISSQPPQTTFISKIAHLPTYLRTGEPLILSHLEEQFVEHHPD